MHDNRLTCDCSKVNLLCSGVHSAKACTASLSDITLSESWLCNCLAAATAAWPLASPLAVYLYTHALTFAL